MIINKIKASGIHLLLSATIVSFFLFFAITVWYPQPFLDISGLKNIMIILVTVDIILGPILTFVVFKPGKSTLKIDLPIIVTVQIAALVYGMYTIHQGHPAYVAYAVDRFTLTSLVDVNPADAKRPELQASGWWKPILVYAKLPSDPKEQEKLTFEVLSGKPDIDARPEFYEPFEQYRDSVLAGGIPAEKLVATPGSKARLEAFLAKYGKSASEYAFFPLSGKEKDVIWVWNRKSGEPIGILDVNPWALEQVANAQ